MRAILRAGAIGALVAAAAAAGVGAAEADLAVTPAPDSKIRFEAGRGESWTCVGLSSGAPWIGIKSTPAGPSTMYMMFTSGVDVNLLCVGGGAPYVKFTAVKPGP